MNDDAALLRRYVEEGTEEAFAELVRRHVNLVYGAALRRTGGNAQLAADVAQQVFIALARGAQRLSPQTVLPAWLHTATRNAALNLMTSERRRRRRESEAVASGVAGVASEAAPAWEELRPWLDAAVDELPEADRASVILRFFERRPFAEIGAALRVSEDAARVRTERAIEKLRVLLHRRGIRSTAAALAACVGSQSSISAPAGLAATLAAQSLAASGGAALAGGVSSFMSIKIVSTAGIAAVIAFFAGSYFGPRQSPASIAVPPPAEDSALVQRLEAERRANQRLQLELAALQATATALRETNAELAAKAAAVSASTPRAVAGKSPTIGLPRHEIQQAVLGNLRQIAAARDQYRLEQGRSPENAAALVGPKGFIRAVRTVGGEDYSELSLAGNGPLTVTTPDGISVTYDPTGVQTTKPEFPPEVLRAQELGRKTKPAVDKALAAFRAANNGNNPKDEQALLHYFASPQEGADFVEFVEARKAAGM